MQVVCENCGNEFYCTPSRYNGSRHHCCSRECIRDVVMMERIASGAYLNCTCEVCGQAFHLKKSHAEDGGVHCCSMECANVLRRIKMSGSNNHQFGLKGSLNVSWVSDERITNYGYRKIRIEDHPFRDCDGFVFEHRLVAEKYLLTDENSIEIDGKRYLRKEYAVHHKDEDKLNNDVSNLIVMTKSEHTVLHNKKQDRSRDSLGRYLPKQ